VTSSLAVFEAGIRVKSRHPIKSCLKTRKKRENMKIKDILHKYLKDCLDIDFTACSGELMTEEALTSFVVAYLTHITSFRVRHDY